MRLESGGVSQITVNVNVPVNVPFRREIANNCHSELRRKRNEESQPLSSSHTIEISRPVRDEK